ncbi:hypothetical protein HNQ02_002195 [Flavobacterium sp. 7E]|uniref:hypothetical protein n=1 Tax=Flavobacterium sp. 7E TaxID=2735898 RepID=UPI00156D7BC8|nr:hypothetical protein [Flavobacterium sp. 7E]NRS89269.1 hypothetical protein [Flavobacterium sp. 7E]
MKKIKKRFINVNVIKGMMSITLLFTALMSCSNDDDKTKNDSANNGIVVKTSEVINSSYIGNGVQWDPYPQAYKYWNKPISATDWDKMYKRLQFMKPSFVRVVIGAYDKYASGNADGYDPELYIEGLEKVLQHCQDNNITVMFGDWGFGPYDINANTVLQSRVENAAKYLAYLVNTKGFTCIKYYNTVNEPNYSASANGGNYNLWKKASLAFYDEMIVLGIDSKVKLAGPDISYFGESDLEWFSKSAQDFGSKIGIYDVHLYPSKGSMFSNEFENTLAKIKKNIPAGAEIVVGEFGFKYEVGDSNMDKALSAQNISNINADPFIGQDSNTMVSQYFYGVDICALTMKIINAGYSGAINWGLDDAMHSNSSSGTDLKVWGFWNILGEELLGDASKEELRPHFYSYSLLARYMQKGSKVFKVELPSVVGLDVIAIENGGKYMIAISNMHSKEYTMPLSIDGISQLTGVKKFVYKEDGRKVDANGFPLPEIENMVLKSGETVSIPKESVTVFTNFDY